MYSSTYFSSEAFTKTSFNHGSFEYLIQYARRLLEFAAGTVEIRDAYGVLVANVYTDDGEIIEWINTRVTSYAA